MSTKEKITRGNASQFFVAGELCRRGYSAVVTLGNTPNTDILCSNIEGTKFVHIHVKTFVPGKRTCSVGRKEENYYGENFFWVLGGIPQPNTRDDFVYYIIPSKDMADSVKESHQQWLATPGKNGQEHQQNDMRTVCIPPAIPKHGSLDLSKYKNQWNLIEEKLNA